MQTTRPATRRMEQGHQTLAALLNYWLGRSSLSQKQLAAIAAWGQRETGGLDGSVLSRIGSGKTARGCSIKNLLAFDAANHAIHLYQVRGEEAAIKALGPYSSWGVKRPSLEAAIWLPRPDDPEQPLVFADFAEILAGLLPVPYLPTSGLSTNQERQLAERLSDLMNDVLVEAGTKPRDAEAALLRAYPIAAPLRRARLKACVLGDDRYAGEELEAELLALAETIRVLRHLEPGSYGPDELLAELHGSGGQ